MEPLTRYEIMEQLDRLGISKPQERALFIEDYLSYFNARDMNPVGEFFSRLRNYFFKKN